MTQVGHQEILLEAIEQLLALVSPINCPGWKEREKKRERERERERERGAFSDEY